MTSDFQKKILTRGYYLVIIRPFPYLEKRVPDIASLYPILEKKNVQIRGWDFPHINYRDEYHIDLNWIGQEFEWEHYKAVWRFYQSGQFFHLSAIPSDWRDESKFWPADMNWKPNTRLGVGDTIATFTEIFEFAARLTLTEAGSETMGIHVVIGNINNRFLYSDSRSHGPLLYEYKASIDNFPYLLKFNQSDLIANSRSIALEASKELFQRFHWNFVNMEILRSWQEEFQA